MCFLKKDSLDLSPCIQVKELFDDALKERNEAWDLYGRLGIPDKPKLGFPTLEEVDMKTIHEAYQYLSHKFVDSVASNTAENKKGYVSIDDLKANNVRRNSSVGIDKKLKANETMTTDGNRLSTRRGSVQPRTSSRRDSTVVGARRGSVNELTIPGNLNRSKSASGSR